MYTFLKRSRLHEPMVLIVKQINDLATDPTSVPHTHSAGFQTGRPANIQNAVYGKNPSVLPYDGRRPDTAVYVEFLLFLRKSFMHFCDFQHAGQALSAHRNNQFYRTSVRYYCITRFIIRKANKKKNTACQITSCINTQEHL